jgi:hypothetical protein
MRTYLLTFLTGNAAALIASAFARALPEPKPLGSPWYQFFYTFTQNLLANFDKSSPAK